METNSRAEKAQQVLKAVFTLVPIVAGADKFTNLLTNWGNYLPQWAVNISPLPEHTFMMVVGAIEIVAGVLVFVKPKIGSIVVCVWLTVIALLLVSSGKYLDVAVRDLVMAASAFVLFTLTE